MSAAENEPQKEASFQVRRATLDDLPQLKELWSQAGLPLAENERRLTEFQVVLSSDQRLAGCIGLQIKAHQGHIHSLVWERNTPEETMRQLLWKRLQTLARNYGLFRFWTREKALFWRSSGFQDATDETFQKLPHEFGAPGPGWLTLQLIGEHHPAIAIDQQFELFKMAQREESERALRQARIFKGIAWAIFFLAMIAIMLLALWIFPKLR